MPTSCATLFCPRSSSESEESLLLFLSFFSFLLFLSFFSFLSLFAIVSQASNASNPKGAWTVDLRANCTGDDSIDSKLCLPRKRDACKLGQEADMIICRAQRDYWIRCTILSLIEVDSCCTTWKYAPRL